jgi:hypothetical protein
MAFLYPAFLVGALAVAIPIALHLLRRDVAPDVPFSAVRLLRRSPVERSRRRHLRDLLLLASRVAALLLLAFAFARPYLQAAVPAGVRIVALDRSYSMGSAERFERARTLARAALDEARRGDRVGLITFDDSAQVAAALGSVAEARAALDAITPGFGGTRYSAALAGAVELAAGADGHLAIVTDMQESGWGKDAAGSLPTGWTVDIKDVGAAAANLGVTAVAVEPDRILASLRNSGPDGRAGRIRVDLDGREVASAAYNVQGGSIVNVPIAWRAPGAGAVSVSVEDPDGLAGDNARHVMLGAATATRVLVVTGGRGGLYLSRALETPAGDDERFDVTSATGATLASMPGEELSAHPVVVLLSTRGLDRRARERLATHVRSGAGLLVAAGPDIEIPVLSSLVDWQPALSATEEETPQLTLSATDMRHPIFRPFGALAANLGQAAFARAWRVSPEGWSVIGRFSTGAPALLERTPDANTDRGRIVLFASDVDRRWNDFPLHPAFVPFALETVRYAAGDRRMGREYLVADAPRGAGPGPGIFTTADNRVVAVNADPREGELQRVTRDAFQEKVRRSGEGSGHPNEIRALQTEARQSYWQYGLLVMIAALVAESFAGRA